MLKILTVSAFALIAGVSSASSTTFEFEGAFNGGTLDVLGNIGVTGGVITSGYVDLTGPGIVGTQKLGIVGVGQTYEATGGTEVFGQDDIWPLTSNGAAFGSNAPLSLFNGYVFSIAHYSDPSEYQGFVGGGPNNLGSYTGELTLVSSSAPEASTWMMLLIGFVGMSVAALRTRRTARLAL